MRQPVVVDDTPAIGQALRLRKIFFATGSFISACLGTASIAPVLGLI